MIVCADPLVRWLQAYPFDRTLGDLAFMSDIEPCRARIGMVGQLLGFLERAAVGHVGGQADSAERMVAKGRRDAGLAGAAP